jgi:polysaccharide chain length determinant protein (PEP-CTERM system associated)
LAEQIFSHLKATWRYRWFAVIFAWVVAIGGWIGVYLTPNRYEASARVYVDTESVLRPLLAGVTVQPNIDQIVTMMSRTLISRPNLEKVIRMADIDIRLKTPEDREALISRLTRELTIKSAGRENLYTIAYSDKDPQESKRVVQSLLTIFVEGSLGDKRKDSDTARRFIDDQLKAYGEKLVAAENAVTEFKRRNMGLMGVSAGSFYTRMGEAKAAVNQAALELKEAENGRDAIKKQLGGDIETPPSLFDDRSTSASTSTAEAALPGNPEIDGRIRALEQKLDALRLNYTEQHPDIVGIKRIMDQLKEQKKQDAEQKRQAAEQKRQEAKGKSPSVSANTQSRNPVIQQLSVSLAEAEATVAAMKARVAEYERRYNELKGAANAVPQVEAEFIQLNRDYDVTKGNYEKLLSRRESAQISGDMETNASVIDFRVIDPPQVPSTPAAPNRPLLISIVFLVALGGGAAFAFLISQLKPTFHDQRRLRQVSGLPVFGTVVMVWSAAQKKKWRRGLVAFMLSLISLLSAYLAILGALSLTVLKA